MGDLFENSETEKAGVLSQETLADNFDIYYQAISQNDASFDGTLFVAVKTTSIFCRPTCPARLPLRKNVEFFTDAKQALAHGYRPCKRCKPLELPDETPKEIARLLRQISANPTEPIRDQDLREMGLQPEKIRRWFNKHHHMTFQAYQRMLRLNISYEGLASGERVTDMAFDAGYESLSGFNTRFKSVIGTQPAAVKNGKSSLMKIVFERFTTPLGPMIAGATKEGLCLLEFTDRRMLESELQDLQKRLGSVILPGQSDIIQQTRQELTRYFEGQLKEFTVPLHTPGTPFQLEVWQQLLTIPYGTTRSYKQQALNINNPKAVRAVASANGMNRVSIIIPCHRVIGSDGKLVGYGGGLHRKEWLLAHEQGFLNLL